MPSAPSARVRRPTSGPRRAVIAVAMMLATTATPGWAAKIYRCGNVFQDLPCPEPKASEQRPAERPATARDAIPCGGATKDGGRSDCLVRTATRDTQTASTVETKR